MAENQVFLAKTYQGLEDVLAGEILAIGGRDVRTLNKGVRFEGNKSLLYEANIRLRTATRILVLWTEFEAKNDPSFFEGIKAIDWSSLLGLKESFALDMILTTDYFENANSLTKHATEAIAEQVRRKTGRRANLHELNPTVRFHFHIHENQVLVFLDSSCEQLAWRGWRKGKTEGRLTDAFVAGLIARTGWTGEMPFLDGICGTGQAVAEAAMIAGGMSPGLTRDSFGFSRWPDFDAELFKRLRTKCITLEHNMASDVTGWTRSQLDINTAQRNAISAHLTKMVAWEKVNLLRPVVPAKPGLLYLFVDEVKAAGYQEILKVIKSQFGDWKVLLVGPEGEWHRQMGLSKEPAVIVAEQGRRFSWVFFKGDDLNLG